MKVLITGASGFTGYYLQEKLKSHSCEVICLKADLTNKKDLIKELRTLVFDYVIHLAAISNTQYSKLEDLYNINTLGTDYLLESFLILNKNLKKILLVSSANIYGDTKDLPITEESIPVPNNHYALSKFAMEYIARTYEDKLPIIFARPFNYTGVGQSSNFVIPKIINKFKTNDEFIELGNINVKREFNDVRYVVDVYFQLLLKGVESEVYNICSGNSYSIVSIMEMLFTLTSHKMDIRINKNFLRDNEIHELYGSPKKIKTLCDLSSEINIKETLNWMLS